MENITSTIGLKYAIEQLEYKHAGNAQRLETDFVIVIESLKPANLIKNALGNLTETSDVMDNILSGAVGLASGYLTRKITAGTSGNIVKKLIGTILQFGVTSVVARHPQTIRAIGKFILGKTFRKKEQQQMQ